MEWVLDRIKYVEQFEDKVNKTQFVNYKLDNVLVTWNCSHNLLQVKVARKQNKSAFINLHYDKLLQSN